MKFDIEVPINYATMYLTRKFNIEDPINYATMYLTKKFDIEVLKLLLMNIDLYVLDEDDKSLFILIELGKCKNYKAFEGLLSILLESGKCKNYKNFRRFD